LEEAPLYLKSRRALWAAAASTIAAAVVAVLAVREVAVRVLHPHPSFTPLTVGSPIVGTIGLTLVAIYVFAGTVSYPNPVSTWRRVAAAAMVLSFVPCVLLAISHLMAEAGPRLAP